MNKKESGEKKEDAVGLNRALLMATVIRAGEMHSAIENERASELLSFCVVAVGVSCNCKVPCSCKALSQCQQWNSH